MAINTYSELLTFKEKIVSYFKKIQADDTFVQKQYCVFFSYGSQDQRCQVWSSSDAQIDLVQKRLLNFIDKTFEKNKQLLHWLKIDFVYNVELCAWDAVVKSVAQQKHNNHFRKGISFDEEFKICFLEQEVYAKAIIKARVFNEPNFFDEKNLNAAIQKKYPSIHKDLKLSEIKQVWLFDTYSIFWEQGGFIELISTGCENGVRILDRKDKKQHIKNIIIKNAKFLHDQIQDSGQMVYGFYPAYDRPIKAYNTIRHCTSIYALLESLEVEYNLNYIENIKKAIDYAISAFYREHNDHAVMIDQSASGDEVKLGALAAAIFMMAKYQEITQDQQYQIYAKKLASGILSMIDPQGETTHVLEYPCFALKEKFRIIYYDGEAALALLRLYHINKDPVLLNTVKKMFEHFIVKKYEKHHDHWLSYCTNELYQIDPDEQYLQFGLKNYLKHMGFIENRKTAYATFLELLMSAYKMVEKVKQQGRDDIEEIAQYQQLKALIESRVEFQRATGFFYPELAMYMAKPAKIENGFYVRHDRFRMRNDDQEHNLSGFIAYYKFFEQGDGDGTPTDQQQSKTVNLVFAGDVNLGRRQHYRSKDIGIDQVLDIPTLKSADLAVINLECVISSQGEQGVDKGEGGPYYYRARPEMVEILQKSNIKMVATANNHAGDYGTAALLQQANILAAAGILSCGSGVNFQHALAPVMYCINGVNIALYSIDLTQHHFSATTDRAGTAYFSAQDPAHLRQVLAEQIAKIKDQVHIVLVAAHYGINMAQQPSKQDRAVAYAIIDAGADAVLGSSAHVLQGIEIYNNKPIIHDAGDLLFDSVRSNYAQGGVFQLQLSQQGVQAIEFIPVGIGYGHSTALNGTAALHGCQHFNDLCAAFDTSVELIDDARLRIDLTPYLADTVQAFTAVDSAWSVSEVPEQALIKPIEMGPLTLLGVQLHSHRLSKREMLWIESFWSLNEDTDQDYRIDFTARPLVDTTMKAWGIRMDHDPCDWMIPTSRWKKGVIYRDYYGLRPPYLKDWENIDLQLHVGLVHGQQRLYTSALAHLIALDIPGKDQVKDPIKVNHHLYGAPVELSAPMMNIGQHQTWNAAQLAEITAGTWIVEPPEDWYITSVVAGEKHIPMLPSPTLFIAHDSYDRQRHEQSKMPSKNFDRHTLLKKNMHRLAGAMISQPVVGLAADFPLLYVQDPIKAMIDLGLAARARFEQPVIAVTGTVGKSTTVELLKSIFQCSDRKVLCSIDNYNSRVGAPGLLASLSPDYDAAIVEVAQSALWMKRGPITQQIKPNIAIITEIGLSQTNANIRSSFDVANYKSRIFDGLQGMAVAIIGEHLEHFDFILEQAQRYAKKVVSYGFGAQHMIRLEKLNLTEHGSLIRFHVENKSFDLTIPIPGAGAIHNAAAAFAAAYVLGIDIQDIQQGIKTFKLSHARLQKFQINLQGQQLTVIDDSFNAEVLSMINAFSIVNAITTPGRKIAVLGRIVHLGDMSAQLHASLAPPLLATDIDLVLTHGEEMKALRQQLPVEHLGPHFENAASLVNYIKQQAISGDLILIKGSRRDSDFGEIGEALSEFMVKADALSSAAAF